MILSAASNIVQLKYIGMSSNMYSSLKILLVLFLIISNGVVSIITIDFMESNMTSIYENMEENNFEQFGPQVVQAFKLLIVDGVYGDGMNFPSNFIF